MDTNQGIPFAESTDFIEDYPAVSAQLAEALAYKLGYRRTMLSGLNWPDTEVGFGVQGYCYQAVQDDAGNLYSTYDLAVGNWDAEIAVIACHSPGGELVWAKQIGGGGADFWFGHIMYCANGFLYAVVLGPLTHVFKMDTSDGSILARNSFDNDTNTWYPNFISGIAVYGDTAVFACDYGAGGRGYTWLDSHTLEHRYSFAATPDSSANDGTEVKVFDGRFYGRIQLGDSYQYVVLSDIDGDPSNAANVDVLFGVDLYDGTNAWTFNGWVVRDGTIIQAMSSAGATENHMACYTLDGTLLWRRALPYVAATFNNGRDLLLTENGVLASFRSTAPKEGRLLHVVDGRADFEIRVQVFEDAARTTQTNLEDMYHWSYLNGYAALAGDTFNPTSPSGDSYIPHVFRVDTRGARFVKDPAVRSDGSYYRVTKRAAPGFMGPDASLFSGAALLTHTFTIAAATGFTVDPLATLPPITDFTGLDTVVGF